VDIGVVSAFLSLLDGHVTAQAITTRKRAELVVTVDRYAETHANSGVVGDRHRLSFS
jgi:hypothetical protein